jgi:hypothetical protein
MNVSMAAALIVALFFWAQGGLGGQGAGWAVVIAGFGVAWFGSILTSKGKG